VGPFPEIGGVAEPVAPQSEHGSQPERLRAVDREVRHRVAELFGNAHRFVEQRARSFVAVGVEMAAGNANRNRQVVTLRRDSRLFRQRG
jgi:hypothetical protein